MCELPATFDYLTKNTHTYFSLEEGRGEWFNGYGFGAVENSRGLTLFSISAVHF
jgi:hypothetical protein